MNFELGKQYIVEVTNKGIISIDEFSTERFFDKDNDDLEFLTDEEKTEVINKVLAGVKAKIKTFAIAEKSKYDRGFNEAILKCFNAVDNIGKESEE